MGGCYSALADNRKTGFCVNFLIFKVTKGQNFHIKFLVFKLLAVSNKCKILKYFEGQVKYI